MKVIVGLSGGVDSSVAACLLKKAGCDVIGVTLRTWDSGSSRCCEIDSARESARALCIPYRVINCVSAFRDKVEKPFIESYLRGITPNPCVICNRFVKWEWMLYAADVMDADAVATGHFASVVRLENGRYTVKRAADAKKDQSYMLYRLTQAELSRTVLPLGGLTKAEVRKIARDAGLPSAEMPDSQEVCFVSEGSYADLVKSRAPEDYPDEGNFVDEDGHILGTHRGIFRYTVGQRRGLGLALGYPAFVKEIRAGTNEVVIGSAESLYVSEILCRELSFMSIPQLRRGEALPCMAKIRYHHEARSATIASEEDGTVRLYFSSPVRAPAPGQSAVFYDENGLIIGGGIIE